MYNIICEVIKCNIIYTSKRLERKCLAVGTVPIYYGTSLQLNLTVVRWDNLKKKKKKSEKGKLKIVFFLRDKNLK